MPRRVVPILVPLLLLAAASSRRPSNSRWTERINVALSAMARFSRLIFDALLP